ncbi:MAG TPA: RNA polymerase sporulation sigma factor SigH [Tissierellaceae bacterium]|nr:RNA polymerase sporulation sigma factor SigH [Tissierellaceae bacterium]
MALEFYEGEDLLRDNDMNDEDIVRMAKEGNVLASEYIINQYKGFVVSKARTYFLIGADRDDIIQEGMIGLYKAVRDYDVDKAASFKYFAEICITRQIITAIKTATRQKHIPLNSYVSLDKPIYIEESERTLLDVIEGTKTLDPVQEFMIQEKMEDMETRIYGILSDLEAQVLRAYIEGKTYEEIAEELIRDKKSIDNALQRVKKKVEGDLGNLFSKLY